MTPKEALWNRYYDSIKRGNKAEAAQILKQIHHSPSRKPISKGGCSKCSQRWRR